MPETEEYGISSFVYEARRPFNPQRFDLLLRSDFEGILRSKGFFWLATKHEMIASWSRAGGSSHIAPAGIWWAAQPRDEWPLDEAKFYARKHLRFWRDRVLTHFFNKQR